MFPVRRLSVDVITMTLPNMTVQMVFARESLVPLPRAAWRGTVHHVLVSLMDGADMPTKVCGSTKAAGAFWVHADVPIVGPTLVNECVGSNVAWGSAYC